MYLEDIWYDLSDKIKALHFQRHHTEAIWHDRFNYPPSPNIQEYNEEMQYEMAKFDYEEEQRQLEAERHFEEEYHQSVCPTCGCDQCYSG